MGFFKNKADPLSHRETLRRIAARGVEIGAVIDVGAAAGAWSMDARRYWPDAHCHLLEAKESWRRSLQELAQTQKNLSFEIKGASAEPGVAYFPKGADEYGGAVFNDPSVRGDLEKIPTTSIDAEVAHLGLNAPFAIKLDTHGTEVDILTGAEKTLNETALICIETYTMIGQKRFPEMILHLQERGFRCADIAEPLHRPADGLLWQLDLYFLRKENPVFENFRFE